eukprot:COSAG04_NODE_618_length_11896_cov_81.925659_4_plen_104_part_00
MASSGVESVDAQLDEFVEAGKSCEKVLAEEPDNVKAVFRLGQVRSALSWHSLAAVSCAGFVARWNVKAVFRLGQVFNGLHEYEKAERHWKHAAKLVRSLGAFC